MTAPRGQIVELDGLRGIAILAVVFNHQWVPQGGWWTPVDSFAGVGWLGVDLFFVISGFLICGILIDSHGAPHWMKNFYARRSLRIFPLYYAFLIAAFTIPPLIQGGPYFQTAWIQATGAPLWYFTYLTNLRPAITGIEVPGLIRGLWTLAIEEQFYLLFPLTILLLGIRRLPLMLGSLVGLALIVRVSMYQLWPGNSQLEAILTPARMDLIALGCLAALLVRSPWWASVIPRSGVALGGAGILLLVTGITTQFDRTDPLFRTLGYSATALAGFLVVLWCIARRGSRAAGVLRARWLTRFGALCYGIYILHDVVSLVMHHAFLRFDPAGHIAPVLRFLLIVLAVYATAECSWHWFEGPINRLKRRFVSQVDWHDRHPDSLPLAPEGLAGGANHV